MSGRLFDAERPRKTWPRVPPENAGPLFDPLRVTSEADLDVRIRSLTRAQRRALDHIAIGRDGGHHPRVLDALCDLGLVIQREQKDGPFTIYRYEVPVIVHVAWCRACSASRRRDP